MKATFLSTAIVGVSAFAGTLSGGPQPSAGMVGAEMLGSATAEILHSVTGRPIPGMPVHVLLIVPPEGNPGDPQVFTTGRDGRALLSPLEDGAYEVYVEYNNHRSRSAFFVIDGMIDVHPFVTLHFNPDID